MKNYSAFLFFFFLTATYAKAQSNFKEGTIVTLKGDTIKGYIDFREWDLNPTRIKFKEVNSEVQKQFTPSEILSFTLKDAVEYHAFNVNISLAHTDLSHAPVGKDGRSIDNTVFLKLIEKGKSVKLFSYNDDIKKRFYTLTTFDNVPQELHYVVYYPTSDMSAGVIINNIYRGQLLSIAKSVNAASSKNQQAIDMAEYKLSDLQNIINLINDEQNLVQNKQKRNKVKRLFVGASLNAVTSSYSGNHELDGASTTSYTPRISVGIDVPFFPEVGRLIFRGEFSLTSYKTDFDYDRTFYSYMTLSNVSYNVTNTYNQISTSLAPQLLYNFYNTSGFKLYAGGGISLNYTFYSNNTVSSNRSDSSNPRSIHHPALYSINIALPVRLGISIKKNIELYSIYHTPAGVTRHSNYKISSQSFGAGINYRFR